MPSTLPPFVSRVQATLHTHAMVLPGERILVAVSGGPDSVCLLDVLQELGLPLVVAHFDHQTRNGESTRDAEFVCNLSNSMGLHFCLATRPVAQEAQEQSLSFEEYARNVRYEALVRMAHEQGCTVLATGHHADDQAETLLMRLLRGTSPHGLCGIPPVRLEGSLRIVRPLIEISRDEILAYIREKGLAYCTDHSNLDTAYQRNRIRHELLPLLRESYNPCINNALNRLSELLRAENDLISRQARIALAACTNPDGTLSRHTFAETHLALQRRIVLLFAWKHGVECPFERVEEVRAFIAQGPTGRAADFGSGIQLYNNRDTTEVRAPRVPADETEVALMVPGETTAFGVRFVTRFLVPMPVNSLARYCRPARQVFDAERVGTRLVVRHRRPGDRFTPFGMRGTRKLKDYFIDIGIPAAHRDAQVVLVGDDGVVWIVGYAISHHAAVTPDTARMLEVEVMDATA